MRKAIGLVGAMALAIVGCQKAAKFGLPPRGSRPATIAVAAPKVEAPPEPKTAPPVFVAADLVWKEPDAAELEPPVPIRFVSASADRDDWAKLKQFWNESSDVNPKLSADQAAVLVGAAPWNLGPLAAQINHVVKIKVPLGLDDPLAYTPAANRPTLGKWQLGQQLFFDKEGFLQEPTAEVKHSCATCHDPAKGFSDGKVPPLGAVAVPRLLNSAYNNYLFWDGRANALEEVVQRSIDERTNAVGDPSQRHNWTGVVERLRKNDHYVHRFRKVFGTPPTQDAVGKAIATYLRTLLSGASVQDRAERELRQRGGNVLEARDYEKALSNADVEMVQPEKGMSKGDLAKQLNDGHNLFRGKAGCSLCHGGTSYTDNSFHNLGIGDRDRQPLEGQEPGRFAVLPIGLKDRRMIGAYKTPSLRSLPLTGPFFHDGHILGEDALFEAVRYHVKGGTPNPYLDPAIRPLDLKETEVRALMLFLKGLEGEALPKEVLEGTPPPEQLKPPKKELTVK